MRDYEMMFIMHPDRDAAGIKAVLDSVSERIGRDGTISRFDLIGRRRLAYTIKKQHQGTYALVNFTYPPDKIDTLRTFMQIEHHETILKYLLLLDEKRGIRPPSQPMPDDKAVEEATRAAAAEAAAKIAVEVVVEGAEEAAEPVAEAPVAAEAAAVEEAAPVAAEAVEEAVAEAPAVEAAPAAEEAAPEA